MTVGESHKCRPPCSYEGLYGPGEVSPSMYFMFDVGDTWTCEEGHTWTYRGGHWALGGEADAGK